MKRLFIFLLCCLFVDRSAIAAERWAIVVGIGSYPETSGWRPINGDKDLGLVVPMLKKNGFPEPRSILETKYGTILLNTQTKVFDYYTLEFSYNDKWVLGRMQGTQHTNYGELEA